jgi:hypothetical protein
MSAEQASPASPGRAGIAALLAALGAIAFGAKARAAEGLSAAQEAAFHLKVLSYDRDLKERCRGKLIIAVAYLSGSRTSEQAQAEMVEAFREASAKFTIQGMAAQVVAVAVDPRNPRPMLEEAGATVVYLTPGLDGAMESVLEAAVALRAPTLCRFRSWVASGIAIGVGSLAGKPRIFINIKSARAASMQLSPELLGLADVLR